MLKSMLKKRKDEPFLLNIKITKKEFTAIKRKAKLHTKGNVSAWLRYAGAKLSPRKQDIA